MIKRQVIGVLIGMVLFVGCSKPKVEVLAGREGANFILTANPKDAKISFFKKDPTKEQGKQILDVEFVLQGKSIEMNLLSNPLYMKLELGSEYTYKVEKSGFVSQEGEVILKLGENLEKNIILYTEEELNSKKVENWSEYLGNMNWDIASKKCNEVTGRRLPTVRELFLAKEAGITKSWSINGNYYWSSDSYDRGNGHKLVDVIDGGYCGDDYCDAIRFRNFGIRCRR